MNEAILKWLASGTIGVVVCASLWLAGTVQKEITDDHTILGKASMPAQAVSHRRDIHLAARPAERAASGVAVRAVFVLN